MRFSENTNEHSNKAETKIFLEYFIIRHTNCTKYGVFFSNENCHIQLTKIRCHLSFYKQTVEKIKIAAWCHDHHIILLSF